MGYYCCARNASLVDNAYWFFCALPLRFATRHGARGCGKTPVPWVSLAPEALASPTAMLLPPLTRLISIAE